MYILSSSALPRKLAREDAIDRVYHRVMSIHKEENKHYKESNNIAKKSIHNTEIKITALVLIIIVIVAVLIIIVLGFCLLKYYFKAKLLRKKRANELEEPYEYIEKKDQNNKEYLDPNAINE